MNISDLVQTVEMNLGEVKAQLDEKGERHPTNLLEAARRFRESAELLEETIGGGK